MDVADQAHTPLPLSRVPTVEGQLPLIGHNLTLIRALPTLLSPERQQVSRLWRCKLLGPPETYLWLSSQAFDLFKNQVTASPDAGEVGRLITGYHSMIITDGADHRRRRRATGHPFTPKGLTRSGVSQVISEEVLKRARAMAARAEVTLLEETQGLALDVIFRIMGIPQEELALWAERYVSILMGMLGPQRALPGLPYNRGKKAREWLDGRLQLYIEQARRGELETGLVAEFVRGRDEDGQALGDEEILDNLRLMLLAGHETTASTMAWMTCYAATRSEVLDALLAEARATESLPSSPQEMGAFPYAEALFRECLRLHPPAPLIHRITTEDLVIEGYEVPAGTALGVPIWLLARDPELYPDPDRFHPERWLGARKKLTPLETAPFGGGPHFCLGYHMAWVEAVQFILAWVRELDRAGKRPQLLRFPEESYMPPYVTRPKVKQTRCQLLPA